MSARLRHRLRYLLLAIALLGVAPRTLLPLAMAAPQGQHLLCHAGSEVPEHPLSHCCCEDGCCSVLDGFNGPPASPALAALALTPGAQTLHRTLQQVAAAPWRYREPPGQAPPQTLFV